MRIDRERELSWTNENNRNENCVTSNIELNDYREVELHFDGATTTEQH